MTEVILCFLFGGLVGWIVADLRAYHNLKVNKEIRK